jgi:hypothetical protein
VYKRRRLPARVVPLNVDAGGFEVGARVRIRWVEDAVFVPVVEITKFNETPRVMVSEMRLRRLDECPAFLGEFSYVGRSEWTRVLSLWRARGGCPWKSR